MNMENCDGLQTLQFFVDPVWKKSAQKIVKPKNECSRNNASTRQFMFHADYGSQEHSSRETLQNEMKEKQKQKNEQRQVTKETGFGECNVVVVVVASSSSVTASNAAQHCRQPSQHDSYFGVVGELVWVYLCT